MLKIKDDVDLKELEKFGFKYNAFFNNCCKKVYLNNENDDKNFYEIKGTTREIKLDRLDGQLDDTLYDLIKADLVEKVSE